LASIEEATASDTPTEAGKTEDKLNKINILSLCEKGKVVTLSNRSRATWATTTPLEAKDSIMLC
jgi:hypothetical protein